MSYKLCDDKVDDVSQRTDGALRVSIVVVFVVVFALGVMAGSGTFSFGAGTYCGGKTFSE